ncbi:Isochorismatase domain-containing protein 1 [Thoreauomyces humboldtii]|nr:Isochorismatase domain-containing protein 1 [Thoreauomyces humboldtii]
MAATAASIARAAKNAVTGFPRHRIHPSSTAFLLCDIQERFRGLIWNYPHVISTAAKMLDAATLLDIPVLVTEQNPKALGATVKELDISSAKIVASKTKFSMFTSEIQEYMDANLTGDGSAKRAAVLFGIESHVCVMQTALDLLDHDYNVIVLADGVSSMNQGEVKIALARLRAAGAAVASSESIIFQLLGDAGHPKFRDLSKLVKKHQPTSNAALDALVTPNL